MKHAGENDLGPEPANETEQREGRGAHAGGAKAVNGDFGGQVSRLDARLCDQAQVEVVFFAREVLRQQGADLFGSAAAEVGDKEEDCGANLGD